MPSDPDDLRLIRFSDSIVALAHHLDLRGRAAREVVALTGAEIAIMREIHRRPGATATSISATTGLQRSNVSATAKRLADLELIVRTTAVDGARGVGFRATTRADEALALVQRHWLDTLRGVLTRSQLDAAIAAADTLASLSDALESAPAGTRSLSEDDEVD